MQRFCLIFILLFSHICQAAWGESCTQIPKVSGYNELKQYSYYGYVKSKIEAVDPTVIDPARGCGVLDDTFTICVFNLTKHNAGNAKPCDEITFNLDQTQTLFAADAFASVWVNNDMRNIELTATRVENQLCLMMPTTRGMAPVVCKGVSTAANVIVENCKVSTSCFDPEENKSKMWFNFMGKAYQCTKNSLDKIFYSSSICEDPDHAQVFQTNPYGAFQVAMRRSVTAAIIIYIVIFGFNFILNADQVNFKELAVFVLKIVLVLYFSIGLGRVINIGGVGEEFNDGITKFALPFLLSLTNSMADIVFKAAGSQGLCFFDPQDYPAGYSFYALWDSLDCRTWYYLGGNLSSALAAAGESAGSYAGTIGGSVVDHLGGVFALVVFSLYALVGGNLMICIFCWFFGIFYLSIVVHFLSTYLVCLITLYALCYLAPIFVPMVLFERTKSYFDAWWKLLVSFALRPAIIAGFVALVVTMFDSTFFGNCEFERIVAGSHYLFKLKMPSFQPHLCTNSIGYKFQQIFAYGAGIEKLNIILFKITYYKDYLDLGGDIIKMGAFAFIFYYFSSMVSDFAADITDAGGVETSGVTLSPMAVVEKYKEAREKMKAAKEGTKGGKDAKGKSGGGDAKPPGGGGGGGGKGPEAGGMDKAASVAGK